MFSLSLLLVAVVVSLLLVQCMLGSTKFTMLWYVALPAGGTWLKIGSDVAWSAKGNGYGTVTVPTKLCAIQVKFVHKSGHVSCRTGQYNIDVGDMSAAWMCT